MVLDTLSSPNKGETKGITIQKIVVSPYIFMCYDIYYALIVSDLRRLYESFHNSEQKRLSHCLHGIFRRIFANK